MADESARVLRVPATLDLADAASLRVQLLAGDVRLGWCDLADADSAVLRLLLQGLDLDEHAAALGLATMNENLASAAEEALFVAPAEPTPALAPPPAHVLRDMLQDTLVRDLLVPAGGEEEELAERSVHDRYLVGMLAPRRTRDLPEQFDVVQPQLLRRRGR